MDGEMHRKLPDVDPLCVPGLGGVRLTLLLIHGPNPLQPHEFIEWEVLVGGRRMCTRGAVLGLAPHSQCQVNCVPWQAQKLLAVPHCGRPVWLGTYVPRYLGPCRRIAPPGLTGHKLTPWPQKNCATFLKIDFTPRQFCSDV